MTKVAEANGAAVIINFGECSLEQLVAHHNEMCLTATDFGLTAEPVASFGNVQEGVAACERLHGQILKARERAAAPPKRERKKAAKKVTTEKVTAPAANAVVAGYTEPTKPKAKEKTVAKKAKKTKSAKKAKTASNGTRKSGARLSDDTTITWLADGNPARPDSIFYDRVEKIRKAKNIGLAKKAGGTGADAAECAKRGWAKLGKSSSASA